MTELAGGSRQSVLKIFDYVDVLFSLFMVCMLLRLWIWPQHSDVETIIFISALVMFEFVMVHSGTFMALIPPRYSLLVLVPFYGLFAWVFSMMAGNGGTIMAIYFLAVLSRMRFAFFTSDKGLKARVFKASCIRGLIYLFLLFPFAIFIGDLLPELGLTRPFLLQAGYYTAKGGLDFFLSPPHVAVAFGVLYYSALTYLDFWLVRNPEKLRKTFW